MFAGLMASFLEENKSSSQNQSKASSRRGPSDLQRSASDSLLMRGDSENISGPSASQSFDEDEEGESSTFKTHPSQSISGCDSFQSLSFDTSITSTPPLTPGRSPNKSADSSLIENISRIVESPYDPLLTPAFRYSSPRHPIEPWRFPSPSHPLHSKAYDLSLCMLMRGEASPAVSGLDVSPIVILPANERGKRSVFSSPAVPLPYRDNDSPLKSEGLSKLHGITSPSPRRLFGEGGPVPITDRVQFKQYRIPQSPLSKALSGAEPARSLAALLEENDSWTLGSPAPSPPAKRPSEVLLGPIELAGEDPFVDYTSWVEFPGTPSEKRVAATPPRPNATDESPVVRSKRQYQLHQAPVYVPSSLSRSLNSSQSSSSTSRSGGSSSSNSRKSSGLVGLGPGLMDSFLDKKSAKGFPRNRSTSGGTIASIVIDDDDDDDDEEVPPSSPVRLGKKSRSSKDLLTSWLQSDEDEDNDIRNAGIPPPPKKRRRTISGMD